MRRPAGFDVSFDTGRPGPLQGSIEVKGPTGRAVIAVEVDRAAIEIPGAAGPAHEQIVTPGPPAEAAGTSPGVPVMQSASAPVSPPETGSAALSADGPGTITKEPPSAPGPSREERRPAPPYGEARPSWLGRWLRGPDKPVARAAGAVVLAALMSVRPADFFRPSAAWWHVALVVAILGIVTTAFEMPPLWLTTFVHGLNSVFFVVLSLAAMTRAAGRRACSKRWSWAGPSCTGLVPSSWPPHSVAATGTLPASPRSSPSVSS